VRGCTMARSFSPMPGGPPTNLSMTRTATTSPRCGPAALASSSWLRSSCPATVRHSGHQPPRRDDCPRNGPLELRRLTPMTSAGCSRSLPTLWPCGRTRRPSHAPRRKAGWVGTDELRRQRMGFVGRRPQERRQVPG
jgi:hypothetical protein